MELTKTDRDLLKLVQQDADMTISQLAERVGASPSAVQRRLQRLRDGGVILRTVALADPARLGSITLLVELELERDRPELLPALHQWIGRTPEVQQAWSLTGRGDYTLVVVTRSIDHFYALSSDMMTSNANIRKFTTSVVLKHVKQGLVIPV